MWEINNCQMGVMRSEWYVNSIQGFDSVASLWIINKFIIIPLGQIFPNNTLKDNDR